MDAVWIVGLVGVYLIPTLIVAVRRPTPWLITVAVNVIVGWTIVGWFVALALAMLMPTLRATPAPIDVPSISADPVQPAPSPGNVDFLMSPWRVAVFSMMAPVVYQLWWFWRFFRFARDERFPRARSFWWIFVPLYGWAVTGRLFHDLEARLGPSRTAAFSAQVALALVVAGNVSAGWSGRLNMPLIIVALALSSVLTAGALYQVQTAANAYLRATYPGCRAGWLFPAEIVAVAGGLSLAGLLVLTGVPNVSGRTASTPLPTATAAPRPSPIPATGNVLSLTSDAGDYIGQGRSLVMTEPTWRFLANQANGPDSVTVSVETVATANFVRWTVWLAAPRGQSLHPGTYSNAVRAAFRTGSAPGIDVFGDGRGCNNVSGSFAVTKLTVDQTGNVQSFEARFEQYCESRGAPALRGFIRIGSDPQPESAGLPAGYRLSPLG